MAAPASTLMVALVAAACLSTQAEAQGTASVGALIGIVTSQNGVPLEGADVILESFGSAFTDSQGRFSFSRVPPGNYRLSVHKQGFTGYTRAVGVRAGITERLEMTLGGFADPPAFAGDRVSVPLIRQGNVFLVRALLNGRREAIFYLDTGASLTIISTEVAQELGIFFGPGSPTVTIRTVSGTIQVPVTAVETIQVGGLEARDVSAAVFDLPHASRVVVGLLGNSFLSRFQVQLDPVQGLLMLSR